MLCNYKELYFFLTTTSYFMLMLFSYTLSCSFIYPKIYDTFSLGLSFVYVKYITDVK